MARIIGGIGVSHTPTIGFAYDQHKQHDAGWAPIFEGFAPVQRWLAEKRPDVLFFIFNDHVTSFFFDHYSPFTLGFGDHYAVADEGGGPRALPPVPGHPELAAHIGAALVADEFDMSFFQGKPLDHGLFSPLSVLWPHEPAWPGAVVPLQVGVLQFPIPSAARCWRLGQSLRRAILSFPGDLSVAVVATGGLSHQVHGERAGFNNTEWDLQFLDLIEKDPAQLAQLTLADYARLGGMEGAEVIMWLIMRGALSTNVRKVHQSYYLPAVTGIASIVFEDTGSEPLAESTAHQAAHVGRQLAGAENLQGTYPFTLARSAAAFRLNRFLHGLTQSEARKRFREDPEGAYAEAALSDLERTMLRARDWRALIRYGASFFMLEKFGAVIGSTNNHIYAGMRGQTLEEFQRTRNVPGAVYSVAGTDAAPGDGGLG